LCWQAALIEEFFHLQGIVAEINQAIGAKGVVSNECKMVVQQYGDQIVEMLLAQVIKVNTELGIEVYAIFIFLWENAQS
jgi:hypothetical protein